MNKQYARPLTWTWHQLGLHLSALHSNSPAYHCKNICIMVFRDIIIIMRLYIDQHTENQNWYQVCLSRQSDGCHFSLELVIEDTYHIFIIKILRGSNIMHSRDACVPVHSEEEYVVDSAVGHWWPLPAAVLSVPPPDGNQVTTGVGNNVTTNHITSHTVHIHQRYLHVHVHVRVLLLF